MWILIETADRNTNVLSFETLEKAQLTMHDAFIEILSDQLENIQDEINYIDKEVEENTFYEDAECGIYSYEAWIDRPDGGNINWVIEQIRTTEHDDIDTVQYCCGLLLKTLQTKEQLAKKDWEENWDTDDGVKEGYFYGLQEAVKVIQTSQKLLEESIEKKERN